MSRLFITKREIDFISDLASEYVTDILGQYIIYYPISVLHTNVHEVYDEAIEKIFENPFKMNVLVGQPDRSNSFSKFGIDGESKIELFIQPRNLIDKDLTVSNGDFFVYGSEVYEITNAINIENIFGQAEYERAVKITGQLARVGEFDIEDFKNMLEQSDNFQNSSVQKKFVQQRGLTENEEGATNDTRHIRKRLGDDMAEIALGTGPRKVDVDEDVEGITIDDATAADGNSFYNE